ncbi:MAG: carbohydrate kinase family protein [Candidatus Binatia bacterium]
MAVPPGRRDKAFDVVGLGLNAVDYLCVVPHFPRFNSKLKMTEFQKQAGGQVATALVALSHWGLSTSYIGKVGDDDLGRFTRQELLKEGVDISHMAEAKGAVSQFAFIMVDRQTGERTIVWHREKGVNLTPQELRRQMVTAGKVLHMDGHEMEAALQGARWAREEGISVVLDLDFVYPGTSELLRLTNILISDQNFPSAFTGRSDRLAALQDLLALGPQEVVMTLGKDGALALSPQGSYYCPGFEVKVMDTTGAGDLFHAAFIYGLLQGWDLEARLAFANAAAALKCCCLGGRAGIPTLQEIEAFLSEAGR